MLGPESSATILSHAGAEGGGGSAPHPLVDRVDWDAVTHEAAEVLSAYVKIDSSHPIGRTDQSAAFLADRHREDVAGAEEAAQPRAALVEDEPMPFMSRVPRP